MVLPWIAVAALFAAPLDDLKVAALGGCSALDGCAPRLSERWEASAAGS